MRWVLLLLTSKLLHLCNHIIQTIMAITSDQATKAIQFYQANVDRVTYYGIYDIPRNGSRKLYRLGRQLAASYGKK